MNAGFQKMTVSDPSSLKTFIEGTTGSLVAILNVRYITIDNSAKSESKTEQNTHKK